jgi:hypothetical protein
MNDISSSPQPQIRSEVRFTIQENTDYFRKWVKTDFSRWYRREFQKGHASPRVAIGSARRRDGRLVVCLDFTGPALLVIDRIAAAFPDLQITDGTAWETALLRFKSSAPHDGVIEYEFVDQDGVDWHGPTGHFDRYDDLPEGVSDDEDEGICWMGPTP